MKDPMERLAAERHRMARLSNSVRGSARERNQGRPDMSAASAFGAICRAGCPALKPAGAFCGRAGTPCLARFDSWAASAAAWAASSSISPRPHESQSCCELVMVPFSGTPKARLRRSQKRSELTPRCKSARRAAPLLCGRPSFEASTFPRRGLLLCGPLVSSGLSERPCPHALICRFVTRPRLAASNGFEASRALR